MDMDMNAFQWSLVIVFVYSFTSDNGALKSSNVYAATTMQRIVGGSDAKIENFQHQLSMEMMFMHSCGASIISKTWAVTAAHCVMSLPNPPPWYVRLRAGSTSGFLGGIGGQIHRIKQALPHPGFNKSTTDFDVALLEVTPPFVYSAKVGPIALPEEGKELKPGQVGTVSGWGMKSERALFTPWILQSVSLRVVDRAECARNYTAVKGMVSPRMICAGGFGDGKDSCQGDSGGPFISQDRKLVGVVSWGYGCARKGFPGVYTNVAHPDIRSFIRNVTGL